MPHMTHKDVKKEAFTADLTAAALSKTFTPTRDIIIHHVFIKASENITETVTVMRDSGAGANYDNLLDTTALTAEQHYRYDPDMIMKNGDALVVACTNANTTGSVYGEIVYQER